MRVEKRFEPKLHFRLKSGVTFGVRLENMRIEGDKILLNRAYVPLRMSKPVDISLSSNRVDSIELSLRGYVPENWEPEWGLVFWLLGPGGYLGLGAQWYATEWLALDTGTSWVLGAGAGHGMGMFVGFRILPTNSPFKPFIGASTSGFLFFVSGWRGDYVDEAAVVSGRAGMEYGFNNDRLLLRLEINYVYFLNKKGWPNDHFEERGGWPFDDYVLPWMGLAIVWML